MRSKQGSKVQYKTQGEWGPCGDYRHLHAMTKPDRYDIPHVHGMSRYNKSIFTTLELEQAF